MISRILAALSALTLLLGLVMRLTGNEVIGRYIWIAGSSAVAIWIVVTSIIRLLRRDAGVDIIALLAIAGAIVLGENLTAAVIGLMFASGRALEDYAEGKAMRTMSALLDRAPKTANKYLGDALSVIPISDVVPGDRLLIRGGEVVPVDGLVESAAAVLDESAL